MLFIKKHRRKFSYNYKERIFTTVNSHVNSRESINTNTSKSDNVIPLSELGSRVPYTTHVGASNRHALLAQIQILTQY